MSKVTDTTKTPKELLLLGLMDTVQSGGHPSDFIVQQEKAGQAELDQTASQLPRECNLTDAQLERLGFVLGPDDWFDNVFRDITFPKGWKIVPHTDHDMHSNIVDDRGFIRGGLFYKAAFYDRRGSVRFEPRYYVSECWGEKRRDDKTRYDVRDNGKDEVLFSSERDVIGEKYSDEWVKSAAEGGEECKRDCAKYCEEHEIVLIEGSTYAGYSDEQFEDFLKSWE